VSTRFSPEAATKLREAIHAAGGIEVFAIGRMGPDKCVSDLDIHCRGNENAVPALLRRPRPGEVVIHNHPSGTMKASQADMALAARYGDDGIGVVIVNNVVSEDLWVVEPMAQPVQRIDPAEVQAFFEQTLPGIIEGYESRPGQLQMALRVTEALNDGQVAMLEAGTGTGKSLAYLVPAVLWATQNQTRVAVATYTIALQGQLAAADLPVVHRAGIEFRHATLMGRHNYLCKRKLARALDEVESSAEGQAIRAIGDWAKTTPDGTRGDMAFPVDEDDWDRVTSDADQTLRVRCPHYDTCFYYQARRTAADAHILVVNHHLLLADMAAKHSSGGVGVLPQFDRVVLDEGHHLEDAATLLYEERLGIEGLKRSVRSLLPRKKRPGALAKVLKHHVQALGAMSPDDVEVASAHIDKAIETATDLMTDAPAWFEHLADLVGLDTQSTRRATPSYRESPTWSEQVRPTLSTISSAIYKTIRPLQDLMNVLDSQPKPTSDPHIQSIFELSRALRRLTQKAAFLSAYAAPNDQTVSWLERDRSRRSVPTARLLDAPIEVGDMLREQLFETMQSVVITSATLTVAKGFDHLSNRIGLSSCDRLETGTFASPFDYRTQSILGIPRDLPTPKEPGFAEAVSQLVIEAIKRSDGGTFVLCTSYALVNRLHADAQHELGDTLPLLKQGSMGRGHLLARFKQDRRSVLFGTDSFWEGIDVKGDNLRLVIIPRLPFRVPTEPVQQARHERLEAQGLDPFRAYSLPQAVLRFRQGFGRLIRTQSDRGAVLLLDRRVTNHWYGRVFLSSLPDVPRAQGPRRMVLDRISRLLTPAAADQSPPD
jgi:ATP-dependent DNA helicase DinG